MAKDNEQMTMEEYLLSQLDTPVILKDGTMMTKLRKVLTMMENSLKDYRQRKRDEQLPTYEILRELQVTTEHFNEFQQMMKDGELERMTFNSYEYPSIRLWLRGGQTCVETGGWLILDKEHRWWAMDNDYHKRLTAIGKIKVIK